VLADTSIWIAHLRDSVSGLEKLLNEGQVVCHPAVIGELACGNLKNRLEILSLLHALPMAQQAEHDEVLEFIENYRLMGKGLGYIDMHILASAVLNNVTLWTLDKRLHEISVKLGVQYNPY
jgi:predicted nucleic acid-binding protein